MTTPEQLAQNALNQQPNAVPQPIPTTPVQEQNGNVAFLDSYRDQATAHNAPETNAHAQRATVQDKRDQARAGARRAQTVREEGMKIRQKTVKMLIQSGLRRQARKRRT